MPTNKGESITKIVRFIQTPGDGEYIAAIPIPAKCLIANYGITNLSAWDADEVRVDIGDQADVTGFSNGNLYLTYVYPAPGETSDNILERFTGAYTSQISGSPIWNPTARAMIFKIIQVGGGAGGEALGFVTYTVPVEVGVALKA